MLAAGYFIAVTDVFVDVMLRNRCGVRCFVVCPGSRSAPLTVAVTRMFHQIKAQQQQHSQQQQSHQQQQNTAPALAPVTGAHRSTSTGRDGISYSEQTQPIICHDERGAAFFAVGYARATQQPAVVITSSGTAVANLLPGVIEVHDNVTHILLYAIASCMGDACDVMQHNDAVVRTSRYVTSMMAPSFRCFA